LQLLRRPIRLALEHEELARGDLLCPGFSNSR